MERDAMDVKAEDFEAIAAQRIGWENTPSLCPVRCVTDHGTLTVRRGWFTDGASAGVEVIAIDTGSVRVVVLPSRGMGIWRIESADRVFGWQSPIPGPIHPSLVPIFDPSGLGWLEGFDELLVRCGLESNGAPQWSDDHALLYPLHGRVANLPAGELAIEVDAKSGRLTLEGTITEARLFFKKLRLRSRLTVTAGRSEIEIEDTVTNELSQPATTQMLYHINLGAPLLADGSRVRIASDQVRGKDAVAQGELKHWQRIGPAESGYSERVYFIEPRCREAGEGGSASESAAMLQSPDATRGFGVCFDTQTLPHLVVWKNTAALSDGYVVGIEPATNLPNTRGEETAAGRVVTLGANESVTYRVRLEPLTTASAVADFATRYELD